VGPTDECLISDYLFKKIAFLDCLALSDHFGEQ